MKIKKITNVLGSDIINGDGMEYYLEDEMYSAEINILKNLKFNEVQFEYDKDAREPEYEYKKLTIICEYKGEIMNIISELNEDEFQESGISNSDIEELFNSGDFITSVICELYYI